MLKIIAVSTILPQSYKYCILDSKSCKNSLKINFNWKYQSENTNVFYQAFNNTTTYVLTKGLQWKNNSKLKNCYNFDKRLSMEKTNQNYFLKICFQIFDLVN